MNKNHDTGPKMIDDDGIPPPMPVITRDTITRDVETELDIAIQSLIDRTAESRGLGRRDAAQAVTARIRGLP